MARIANQGTHPQAPKHLPRGGPAIPQRAKWLPPSPVITGDWMVVASICDCNHVAVSVLESYDHDNIEPDAHEVIKIGSDWRPLVIEAAALLHQQLPHCRISPKCTTTYAARGSDREQESVLENAVTDAMYDAFSDGKAQ